MIWLRILGTVALSVGLAACTKAVTDHQAKRPLSDLAGSEWGPADNAQDQFVAFKTAGEIIGSGGCNNFFGNYEQDGDKLTIGALASTRKMCPSGMEAEADFLARLQEARRIEATHKTLVIYDESGDMILELQRRDWD
ncbi:META domain-containing protein [Litorimonas sp. RW-G-Af-16]|uniref:META domain-containing protein n=1 Tax=Litorimonas sp. RW-G-Af-16 TaxID=3241168 RepID=UPI00390C9125